MARAYRFALLLSLYLVQGLPYGVQVVALPLYLRERGISRGSVGLLGFLALPWMFKLLWAPLVDRFGSERFGRRKSWIIPLQVAFAGAAMAGAAACERGALRPMLVTVLLMNLIAATQDIAVDGLAVDVLGRRELGAGNTAQVVGYKIGMLIGGGLLVSLNDTIGWPGIFTGIAVLCLLAPLVLLPFRESPRVAAERPQVLRELWRAMRVPGTGWLLVFCGTYKVGETMVDAMFKLFLQDRGYPSAQLGTWFGTYGMAFSIAGSVAGGALATRWDLLRSVGLTAVTRAVSVLGVVALSVSALSDARALAVLCAEHFFAGALTTAMFAYMMSRVDRRIGASHYTLLATVEVLGKSPGGWSSGFIVDHFGYPALFGLAAFLSVAYLAVFPPMRASARAVTSPS
jgi:MFS transporter, PAT family, beta-lactamase induction signal transducer AmpG